MSIGAALAEARQAAGLTIADVSARTRIRPALICAIEHDDFAACGGDFYARGHIRAIARVVDVDSRPLIATYDAEGTEDPPAALEDLFLPPAAGDEEPPPYLPSPETQARRPERTGARRPRETRAGPAPDPARARRRWLPWLPAPLLLAAVALAVIGGGAYQLAAGSASPRSATAGAPALPRTASSASAQARPATHPATAPPTTAPPSPSPAPKVTHVMPSRVAAVGPGGMADGDNQGGARLALSGNPGSPWRSQWYTTSAFGNLKRGTGLLFRLPHTVTATAVVIRMENAGSGLQVRAGTSTGSLHTVASTPSGGRTVRLRLASRPRVRYLVVWFTRLPPDGNGTYQAAVYGVTVTALRSP